MTLNRRSFILAAGGAGLALVGSAGAYAVTRRPVSALKPWALAADPSEDVRLDALRHAILAPNPHNRQPWLMTLAEDSEVVLACDLERRLPQTDPFDRQITIGFGCFLELARIAAAERGHRLEVALFPQGEPHPRLDRRPIASLRFVPDPTLTRDPLFALIPLRRSTKEPFDLSRTVSKSSLDELSTNDVEGATLLGTNDSERIETLRALVLKAGAIEVATKRTWMESVDLMRIGHQEIDLNPDGIDLDGPMIEGLKLAGMLSREQLADQTSAAFKSGAKRFEATYGSIPALLWLTTPAETRRDQIAAGRAYVRANLKATQRGLAMHPMSQALQEYPEMAEPLAAMHRLLAGGGERVQMLARIGYGPSVPPSPRWALETRLAPA